MKKKILALSLILSLAAFSGCNGGEVEVSDDAQTTPQTSSFTTTAPPTTESAETSEPEREIRTTAETPAELISLYLKAFCDKDTETLTAFRGGSYDDNFNKLCKALDDAGNLPENLDEVDLDPMLFEVYHVYNTVSETWEATYPLANGRFTFLFYLNDFDYATKTYSAKTIKCRDKMDIGSLSSYREHAESGTTVNGITIELLDLSDYFE